MKNLTFFSLSLLLIFTFSSCKKVTHSDVTIQLTHTVGNQDLTWDDIVYTNAAGNEFSVNRLLYFISEIELTDASGATYLWHDFQYVDYEDPSTHTLVLNDVPVGDYVGFHAYIGLDSTHNVTGGLPNTTELNGMAWPDPMGGGYHFLKLEGYYMDTTGNPLGYAMHLGRSENLVSCEQTVSLSFEDETETLNLNFDIMEWHQDPANWDFNVDGTAIMANMTSMAKLSDNGSTVLTVSQ